MLGLYGTLPSCNVHTSLPSNVGGETIRLCSRFLLSESKAPSFRSRGHSDSDAELALPSAFSDSLQLAPEACRFTDLPLFPLSEGPCGDD